MDTTLLQQIVSKVTDETKDLIQQIVDIFNFVRDIPYGDIGSRKPEDVYLKNQWTCSWKHELFKEICQFKWVEVKECIVIHRFIDLPVKFPKEIQNILKSSDILDPHNLLKVKLNNTWLKVDLTRDFPMKELWFPINENRDWKTDQLICAVPSWEAMELEDAIKFKEDFISKLSDQQREQRKLFLKEFTKWLDDRRKTK